MNEERSDNGDDVDELVGGQGGQVSNQPPRASRLGFYVFVCILDAAVRRGPRSLGVRQRCEEQRDRSGHSGGVAATTIPVCVRCVTFHPLSHCVLL